MKSDEFIASGILETYAMGCATEQKAKLVVEMAARYPEVKAELKAIEAALENFDKQNAVEPPNHLKAKILAKVSDSQFSVYGSEIGKSETKVVSIAPQKQSNFFKYAAAVAFVLVIGSVWYALNLTSEISDKDDQLAKLQADNELLNANMATMDTLAQTLGKKNLALLGEMNLLKRPGMKSIVLTGMEEAPDAKAMVYANTTTGDSYLEIMSLPPAPEGMQYQFWGFVDGKPVDAGMIPLEGDLAGIHPMKTIPGSTGYAITLETKGGHPQPVGKIFVMGNV